MKKLLLVISLLAIGCVKEQVVVPQELHSIPVQDSTHIIITVGCKYDSIQYYFEAGEMNDFNMHTGMDWTKSHVWEYSTRDSGTFVAAFNRMIDSCTITVNGRQVTTTYYGSDAFYFYY